MNKTLSIMIPVATLIISRVANTAAAESLELTGGVTRIDTSSGWPSFVTLQGGTILAVRGREARASKDGGKTWSTPKPFVAHLKMGSKAILRLNSAVGLLDPGAITGHVGIKEFVGEIPFDYASADYPNIHFLKDTILLHYDRNPKFGPKAGAYWTLRIFRIEDLYE